jgi:hypothetical protein
VKKECPDLRIGIFFQGTDPKPGRMKIAVQPLYRGQQAAWETEENIRRWPFHSWISIGVSYIVRGTVVDPSPECSLARDEHCSSGRRISIGPFSKSICFLAANPA